MANTFTSIENPRDWRGVPIEPGVTVIYGSPVGRSIAMVEGTVDSFTKSGRVNVRPVRRAYGGGSGHGWETRDVVHVGQDRVTVVAELPPALMPTEDEKRAKHDREQVERRKRHETHLITLDDLGGPLEHWTRKCERCGCAYADSFQRECGAGEADRG